MHRAYVAGPTTHALKRGTLTIQSDFPESESATCGLICAFQSKSS